MDASRTRSPSPRPRRPRRAAWVVVAAAAILFSGVLASPPAAHADRPRGHPQPQPTPAPAAPPAVVKTAATSDSIQLAARIPWLTGTNGFHLVVSMHSSLAPADLELSLQLYPKVTGRSAFEQTLTSSPAANVLEAQLIPLSALGVQGSTGQTSATVTMTLPVTTGEAPFGNQSDAAPTLTLECDLAPPPCDGVYPIEVALVNRADVPLSSFTTFLVYAQKLQNALPMRVGWILPLGGSPTLDPAGVPVLDATDQTAIGTTVQDLDLYPRVGVTLETYGETIVAIDGSADSHALVSDLRALAASPWRQLVGTTFVPVDVGQFARAGLAGELAVQLQAGDSAVHDVLGERVPLSASTWVLDGPTDLSTIAMLKAQGTAHLVLPESALASDSWKYTPTEPFTLGTAAPSSSSGTTGTTGTPGTTGATGSGGTGGPGGPGAAGGSTGTGIDAISADPLLSAHFQNGGNPVLLAEDLMADLAEIYFELPYAHTQLTDGTYEYQPRSVVVQTPAGWQTNDTMLRVVLAGLAEAEQDGILLPTTLTGLLAGDPPGADGEPAIRTLAPAKAPASGTSGTGPTSAAVAGARSDIAAFASLLPSDSSEVGTLDQDVIAGEASDITPAASAALFSLPAAQIASAGALVTLPQGQIVTLTSSTGQVPITIESRSAVPLHVRLVLSAPDTGMRFPSGASLSLVVDHGTTVQDVQINTLTSGDFGLRLSLETPVGGVVLGHGNVTIRSTALSGLAIGLSAGALALLVAWWIRSSRRRRRALATAAAGSEPPDA